MEEKNVLEKIQVTNTQTAHKSGLEYKECQWWEEGGGAGTAACI